jgi:putative membrane protein
MVNLFPLIGTICILTSAILVSVGWYLIIKGRRVAHQRIMITAAIFAVIFLFIYIGRTLFFGNTAFGGPDNLKQFYILFLVFHIFLSVTGLTFGAITLTYGFRGRFMKHKKIGMRAAVIWICSAFTGILVYLALYIVWEPGPITSMRKAILGW